MIEAFCQEYLQRVESLPGVTHIEFIGSITNGNFVPGRSDLDVFVHGHRIPKEGKRQAVALVRELNAKYALGLERAPCQHPTPFFIDSPLRRTLYNLLKGRMELRWLRTTVKRVAPSYSFVWRLQQGK